MNSLHIRDIKIDLLMSNKNPIVDLFNEITNGIKIINTDVYNEDSSELIYYTNQDWIFYQDFKNGDFWCNDVKYWSLFKDKFDLLYEEIQSITKYLIEETLKRELRTPEAISENFLVKVEEALKRELDTTVTETLLFNSFSPFRTHLEAEKVIEEVLKRELNAPMESFVQLNEDIEEALKNNLI